MRWLARLLRRRALERELDDELHFHLEEQVRELRERGLSEAAASRQARLELGGVEQVKELARDVRGTRWLEEAILDARYAVRVLRHQKGFALVVIATLGLGVGAATAIFSTVRPVLIEPLAYPQPRQLVSLADRAPDGSAVPVAFGTFVEVRQRSRSFASVAAFRPWQPTAVGGAEPERLEGLRVTADYFGVLGVGPAFGPGFDTAADRVGGPGIVVLSDGLWRRRYAADPGVVGTQILLNDRMYTVVGVMPPGLEDLPGHPAQLWALLQYDHSLPTFQSREWGHHLAMIGRLRAGAGLDFARAELEQIGSEPLPSFPRPPWAAMEQGLGAVPLRDAATASARPLSLALVGAVALLLTIACVNLTNLLAARAAHRRAELAMRAALGASRARIVRQVLAEGLVLAVLGGAAGLTLARLGIDTLIALSPAELPRVEAIRLDGAAFGFACVLTAIVGLLVSLAPALTPSLDLRADARRGAGAVRFGDNLLRPLLVVAEVALALVLLVGAGLLLRSVQSVLAVAPGFEPESRLAMRVDTSGSGLDDVQTHAFFDDALVAVRALPGVEAAAWTSQLPLSGDADIYGLIPEEGPLEDGGAFRYAVTPGYLETMGVPLRRGRSLDADDLAGAPGAVLINESFARRAFGGRDPLGQRVHVGRTDLPRSTVVGIVGDVKHVSLEAGPADAVYVAAVQWYFADAARWLVVRSATDAEALVPALKAAVWSTDPGQPIVQVADLAALVRRSQGQRRFALTILEAFAGLAVALAGIGLFGVLSGSVTERHREIGVRVALGATPRRIVAMVVGRAAILAGVGAALGLAVAALATRTLSSLLFGVSRVDPLTHLAVVALLGVVTLIACWLPAARAAAVDPARTLRSE